MDSKNIRNFCIISHIDHGKSTLADRFLEMTQTVPKQKMHPQYLDRMPLEQERGITIKLQPVRMEYAGCILNLIDTPGHVDFSYEVSRSLAAVDGAILLVDATQGIQAQTLANLDLAEKQKLVIIPVINKIDLSSARIEETAEELSDLLKISPTKILKCSAKTGEGVKEILERIITDIPAPNSKFAIRNSQQSQNSPTLSALIFDSFYDPYRGVVAMIRIFSGKIKKGERIKFLATAAESQVLETGIFKPELVPTYQLSAGEIGYIFTGIKEIDKVRVGDTITHSPAPAGFKALPGFSIPTPNVFASLFPVEADSFLKLKNAIEKLRLTDSSLQIEPDTSTFLGSGFRIGFLGLLHLEIVKERLQREHKLEVVVVSPSVEYEVITKNQEIIKINKPTDLPSENLIKEIREPQVKLEIILPEKYTGSVLELVQKRYGILKDMEYLVGRVVIKYEIPLSSIITDFYDQLKTITAGFGSYNYHFLGYRSADLVKLDILVAGQKLEAFSEIVRRSAADNRGRFLVNKLKQIIPRQLFEVTLQAAVSGKILAREDIPPLRKDVIAKLYGGDRTRKDKLLKKQAVGKKRMKRFGKVEIPSDVFLKLLK